MIRSPLLLCSLLITVILSCRKKNQPNNTGRFSLYLTATSSIPYDRVDLEITNAVLVVTCKDTDTELINYPLGKTYNLMNLLQNQELLVQATHNKKGCNLEQVRLITGYSNAVIKSSVYYPLEIPSGDKTGIKAPASVTLPQEIILLFTINLDKVLTKTGNKYIMQPQGELQITIVK